MQGANGLLNNMYNLVHQQNSQFLAYRILRIEENFQYASQKNSNKLEVDPRSPTLYLDFE